MEILNGAKLIKLSLTGCCYLSRQRTVTTKKRINQYSSVKVYQKKHEWYLQDGTEFEDRMVVS
jgi:hypothetical protein